MAGRRELVRSGGDRLGGERVDRRAQLVRVLDGMLIMAHPRSQVNVVAPPSIASVIGAVLPSMYNPNLCSDESGRGFSEAEVRVASIAARLVGYDPAAAGGVFTFGGTGTLLYGVKIGLEKALPGSFERGVAGEVERFKVDGPLLSSRQPASRVYKKVADAAS